MPCFRTGPEPGTPQYEAWIPEVRRKHDAFLHVVDYYYRKAGLTMPEPPEDRNRRRGSPRAAPAGDERVLEQILLHLDCDGVDVFQLNDIRNLLARDRTPRGRGYSRVLKYCFVALRKGFHDRPTTAAMWAECQDPALMLDHLKGRLSDRKLRLFAVACCRRVPHLLTDRQHQAALEVAERYADGDAGGAELEAAGAEMGVREIRGYYGPVAAWVVAPSAEDAARYTAWNAFCDRNGMGEERHQADLLRCIAGNPFRPVTTSGEYRTDTVVAMARAMYESRDFSAMPLLADALQDAGCGSTDLIEHCREPNQSHVRGCRVVDFLLGKE